MDGFVKGFIEAMFWTEENNSLGITNHGLADMSPELTHQIEAECARFKEKAGTLIADENCNYTGCPVEEYAGHDFWLTRNGHGSGFCDGNWEKSAGEKLTEIAKSFGQMDIYLGDDGKVYAM